MSMRNGEELELTITPDITTRIRIYYSKGEELRYTGNLDIQKIWERTFRRAHLCLEHSKGFHPQPRINQACPIPLGITSVAEVIEVWLTQSQELDSFFHTLQKALPPGITLRRAEFVDLQQAAVQTFVVATEYLAYLLEPMDLSIIESNISQILSLSSLARNRRGKTYDLRPLIQQLSLVKINNVDALFMQLSAREAATGRPDEVLAALEIPIQNVSLERVRLIPFDLIK